MADAEENQEVELTDETIEFINLLESFGTHERHITAFLANEYTVDTLKIIERKEVEELIPQPYLAERTKFIHSLNDWRKRQGLPLLTELTVAAVAAAPPPPEPELTREACTATYLIQSSAKGQAILNSYATSEFLSRSDKSLLAQLVVDEFKQRFTKLSTTELEQRANELSKLFPSVQKDVWYQSPWGTDSAGRKIKLRKQAKGKLYDRNSNCKKIHPDKSRLPTASASEAPHSAVEISAEKIADYQQIKKWIIHNQDEWEELKNKWKQTSRLRIFELSENNCKTAVSVLTEYPVLRNHQGYQLVQIDFQQRYPEKEKLLFDRWDQFVSGLLPILQLEVHDAEGKAFLEKLKSEETTDDGQSLIAVLLLAHILQSPLLTISQKRRWKPSIVESRESVVIVVKDLTELQTTLTKSLNSYRGKGIESTPFVVVYGEDPKRPDGFAVWNNVVAYKLPNLQKALDVCMKLYKTYDIEFPRQSSLIWNLLAAFLYDFEAPSDQVQVTSLCSSIKNKPAAQ